MNSSHYKGLRYQFLIIGSLIFVLPILVLSYLIYETGVVFSITHLVVFTGILLLILAGLIRKPGTLPVFNLSGVNSPKLASSR